MELMRFPLENTHSRRGHAGWRGCEGGVAAERGVREKEEEGRRTGLKVSSFFLRGGMYLGGKSGTSQGVWSAAEMDHAILLVRCDAHEPWGVNEKRRQPAI